jgi:hypothetical protein
MRISSCDAHMHLPRSFVLSPPRPRPHIHTHARTRAHIKNFSSCTCCPSLSSTSILVYSLIYIRYCPRSLTLTHSTRARPLDRCSLPSSSPRAASRPLPHTYSPSNTICISFTHAHRYHPLIASLLDFIQSYLTSPPLQSLLHLYLRCVDSTISVCSVASITLSYPTFQFSNTHHMMPSFHVHRARALAAALKRTR